MYKVDDREFNSLRKAKQYGYDRNFPEIHKVINKQIVEVYVYHSMNEKYNKIG